LYTMRSSLRQLICVHTTIGFSRVLVIFIALLKLYLPNHRESVSVSMPITGRHLLLIPSLPVRACGLVPTLKSTF
jgi:hypothetical protein